MLLLVFLEFDVMYSATTEMYTGVNITINFIRVTIVVNKENYKKIDIKRKHHRHRSN